MKFKNLIYGIEILDIDLASCSDLYLNQILEMLIEHRLIILRNQRMSLSRFNEINEIFGIHRPANIFATHKEYPKILRVTNKEVKPGKKGLFHHSKEILGWHCNGAFSPDPEDVVALWCINPGDCGGETYFACGIHAYNSLEDSIKEKILLSILLITNDIQKTYLKKSIYGTLLPYEQKDLDKMRTRNRYFAGGQKGNSYDKKKSYILTNRKDIPEGKKRNKEIKKPIVTKHPISEVKGLYFPLYSVGKIIQKNSLSFDSVFSKNLFYILMNSYIGEKGKIYRHRWKKGDLILSDQTHSLHCRTTYSGLRELYRTSFWYHNSNNKNI